VKFVSERIGRSAILGRVKNQYFGDINDYKKYGLLRVLAEGGRNKIAVCWMLTRPDGSTAGNRTRYLHQPERWRKFDPGLFDLLSQAIALKQRNVAFARRANLIPGAVYHAEILGDDAATRKKCFARLQARAASRDLIFFDPDNGLEVKSTPKGSPGASKYLYWDELIAFCRADFSVLVYQHFQRGRGLACDAYTRAVGRAILKRTGVRRVLALCSSEVVFFLLPERRACAKFSALTRRAAARWAPHVALWVIAARGR